MADSYIKQYKNAVKQYKKHYNQMCHTQDETQASEHYLKLCDLDGEINELQVEIAREKRAQYDYENLSASGLIGLNTELKKINNEFDEECKHDYIEKYLEKNILK